MPAATRRQRQTYQTAAAGAPFDPSTLPDHTLKRGRKVRDSSSTPSAGVVGLWPARGTPEQQYKELENATKPHLNRGLRLVSPAGRKLRPSECCPYWKGMDSMLLDLELPRVGEHHDSAWMCPGARSARSAPNPADVPRPDANPATVAARREGASNRSRSQGCGPTLLGDHTGDRTGRTYAPANRHRPGGRRRAASLGADRPAVHTLISDTPSDPPPLSGRRCRAYSPSPVAAECKLTSRRHVSQPPSGAAQCMSPADASTRPELHEYGALSSLKSTGRRMMHSQTHRRGVEGPLLPRRSRRPIDAQAATAAPFDNSYTGPMEGRIVGASPKCWSSGQAKGRLACTPADNLCGGLPTHDPYVAAGGRMRSRSETRSLCGSGVAFHTEVPQVRTPGAKTQARAALRAGSQMHGSGLLSDAEPGPGKHHSPWRPRDHLQGAAPTSTGLDTEMGVFGPGR
eukprot:TRINITY_DN4837_c0_g1_i2.p2 TRINITY_DN4837_c0_g1~~TRINITY_DN4837_c0_g1_i2.p2  ORF type:complete len:457 (+),score=82.11 TRINITY_DN4837_c0_g1_i2:94-1464(+)